MRKLARRIEKDSYRYKNKKGKTISEERFKVIFEFEQSDGTIGKITKKFPQVSQAKTHLETLIREHENKGRAMEHREILFRDYAETYKRTNLGDLRTAAGERGKVDLMIEFFGDIKLANLGRQEIKNFKLHLQKTKHNRTRKVKDKETKELITEDASKSRSPRTVNTYLVRLRTLLREAVLDGKIKVAPDFKRLIDTHLEVKRDKTISFTEFERLLSACEVVKSNHDRKSLKLVLVGLFELGCRKEELQKILVKDIDLDNRIVFVWDGKKKMPKQRMVGITPRLHSALIENNIVDKTSDARAFGNEKYYARSFSTAKTIAGIDADFRLNDIRHCNITNRINAGMSLADVQKQVGHSPKSAMTLDVYHNPRAEQIREANRKLEDYSQTQRARINLEKVNLQSEALN